MKIEEQIAYLRQIHKGFSKQEIYDTDNKGRAFCELIYPNQKKPELPLTLTVSEEGCLISVGKIPNVTGDRPIPCEYAASAIADILNDKILFVLGYSEEDDTFAGAPFYCEIFALTGGEDDMSREYERFLAKLNTPIKGFKRKLTNLKGRFLIFNFSGNVEKTVTR